MVIWINHCVSLRQKLRCWLLDEHVQLKQPKACLDALFLQGLAGPTLQLHSSLILNSKIRDFPSRHRCISHTAGAPKPQGVPTSTGDLLRITGEETSDFAFNGRTLRCFSDSETETSKFPNKMLVWLVLTCECCFRTGSDNNTKQLLFA